MLKITKNSLILYIALGGMLFFFSSCDATRYLAEGETFTGKNRIIFHSPEKIEKKSLLREELSSLYRQNRNINRFGVWIHYKNQDPGDTLWYHSFARRFFAEEPSIFNENLSQITASEMQDFLQFKRGFYAAKVEYRLYDKVPHETGVDYIIHCGKRYRIRSVSYSCEDSLIASIIDNETAASFLRPGEPVSSLDYELEKNRLSNLLQNAGYAQFFQNFIELTGDSSNYQVDLTVNIMNPGENKIHKTYKTGMIRVFTDYHPNQLPANTETLVVDGIQFHRELPEFFVQPTLIASMIGMKQGDTTSKRVRQESYNRLSLLNPYKFIAIKQSVDSVNRDQINYDVLLIPKTGKWYWDNGIQLNYTTLSQFNQLFGVGVNFSLENDNLFHGAEKFITNFNADTDVRIIQFKPQEFFLQYSNNLLFPKPIKLHRYSAFGPLFQFAAQRQYSLFRNYGSTKLSLGASYESLANTIQIISGNVSLGYQYQPSDREVLHLNQISVDYYAPQILNDTLFPGFFYRNSLSPRLVTGFLFKDLAYSYRSNPLFKRFSWEMYAGLEFSGHEISLVNEIYNLATGRQDTWQINASESIKFAKYGKTYLDLRGQYKTGATSRLASRLYMGIGIPYGDNQVLPYTKQFFVGGPQSIRAWEKRGLGPGAFYVAKSEDYEIAYQKGDIKLEANVEYRFDLPWYFEGAVFLDAGNVWSYEDDPDLENENFTVDFYKQIALGSGIGLRLNFNFLLLRLDLGYKMRTPYLEPSTQAHWQIRHINLFEDGYLTFGLDYPF